MQYVWQDKRWPELVWRADRLTEPLGRARFAQGGLLARMRALGFVLGREAQAEILVSEAVKTAAIEGTAVDPHAVRSSVAKQLGLPFGGLPNTDRSIDGLVDMLLDATAHYARPLTAARLQGWQAALFPTGFSGVHRIRIGKWRNASMTVMSGPLGREHIHFEAPPHKKVAREMQRFVSWFRSSHGKMDGLIRAGVAHWYFVTIHPFDDGNGRVARALTDMALAQDEGLAQRYYSVSSQIMTERDAYYDMLEATQKGDVDITRWLMWFLECVARAIANAEILIAGVLVKAEFWQRTATLDFSARQRKVLNRLLDAGPDGFEGGLTTRKYVAMTRCSRATAFREIADLLAKGVLAQRAGRGRNVHYGLCHMPQTPVVPPGANP